MAHLCYALPMFFEICFLVVSFKTLEIRSISTDLVSDQELSFWPANIWCFQISGFFLKNYSSVLLASFLTDWCLKLFTDFLTLFFHFKLQTFFLVAVIANITFIVFYFLFGCSILMYTFLAVASNFSIETSFLLKSSNFLLSSALTLIWMWRGGGG